MGEGEEIVKMKAVDMTLQYYQQNSGEFVTGTVSADMHDTQMRLLRMLPPQAYILDFWLWLWQGCKGFSGSGIQGGCG